MNRGEAASRADRQGSEALSRTVQQGCNEHSRADIQGLAASIWTNRERAAYSSCKHCPLPGKSMPGQRAAQGETVAGLADATTAYRRTYRAHARAMQQSQSQVKDRLARRSRAVKG